MRARLLAGLRRLGNDINRYSGTILLHQICSNDGPKRMQAAWAIISRQHVAMP